MMLCKYEAFIKIQKLQEKLHLISVSHTSDI